MKAQLEPMDVEESVKAVVDGQNRTRRIKKENTIYSKDKEADNMQKERMSVSPIKNEGKNYNDQTLTEKNKFKALDKLDRYQFIHETVCMFDFLQDLSLRIYTGENDGLIPDDDLALGMNLVFDIVGNKIRAMEAIAADAVDNS